MKKIANILAFIALVTVFNSSIKATGLIVLINGPSCAGKTTLSNALLEKLQNESMPAIQNGIDMFLKKYVEDSQYCKKCMKHANKLKKYKIPLISGTYDLWHRAIAQEANEKDSWLLVDHAFADNFGLRNFLYNCKQNNTLVFMIGLKVSPEKLYERLEKRNQDPDSSQHRDKRNLDTHITLYDIIHGNKDYDLDINTDELTTEEVANKVFDTLLLYNDQNIFDNQAFNANYQKNKHDIKTEYKQLDI